MNSLPETVRQQYLSAMGVTQWYARVPVASGSPIDWSTEASAEVAASDTDAPPGPAEPAASATTAVISEAAPMTAAEETSAGASPAAQSLVEPVWDNNPSRSAERPAVPAAAPVAQPVLSAQRSQGIEFGQRWWAHGGWLIIDTRPSGLTERQKTVADRLLANLAQVVSGVRVPEVTHLFDWPLFVNRSIKHDLEEAQFYVRQKWRAIQRQTPTTHLLLLGERSEALLMPALAETADQPEPTVAGDESVKIWQQGSVRCLSGPGTSELLHLPGMKRRLWFALQAWRTALK